MFCQFVAGWDCGFFMETFYLETFEVSRNKISLGKALFLLIAQTKTLSSFVAKLGFATVYNNILSLPIPQEQFLPYFIFQKNFSCVNLSKHLTELLGCPI